MSFTCKNPTKPRKCPECGSRYTPARPELKTCGNLDCKISFADKVAAKAARKREKAQRALDAAKLEALQPIKYWKAKLKTVMHLYVRLRDEGKPCISCDTILLRLGRVGGDYDAGHARSVGSAKHLEFDADRNIHGQCKRCNDHKAGNYAEYCRRLPARIGQEAYDALMSDQQARHYTIEQLQQLIETYKQKVRELK